MLRHELVALALVIRRDLKSTGLGGEGGLEHLVVVSPMCPLIGVIIVVFHH